VSTESVRTLRAGLATAVRRAAQGERIVVTVGGRPMAQLGPLDDHAPELDHLVAAGAVLPPRRTGPWRPPAPVTLWPGVRLDQALRDVRGGPT
jgi:prevent-host-death family protein